jgi:hypothetical protein
VLPGHPRLWDGHSPPWPLHILFQTEDTAFLPPLCLHPFAKEMCHGENSRLLLASGWLGPAAHTSPRGARPFPLVLLHVALAVCLSQVWVLPSLPCSGNCSWSCFSPLQHHFSLRQFLYLSHVIAKPRESIVYLCYLYFLDFPSPTFF